jgi:hypothetical protein
MNVDWIVMTQFNVIIIYNRINILIIFNSRFYSFKLYLKFPIDNILFIIFLNILKIMIPKVFLIKNKKKIIFY